MVLMKVGGVGGPRSGILIGPIICRWSGEVDLSMTLFLSDYPISRCPFDIPFTRIINL